jgi:hypothetical protein
LAILPQPNVSSLDWDIRFVQGYNLLTNSGPSGKGRGGAVGPLDSLQFIFDTAPPASPTPDRAAGTLTNWFTFTEAGVTSRYHIYGVRTEQGLYKVQVLSYHSTLDEESTSGYYRIRYASLSADAAGETQELAEVDASAGGVSPTADAKGACLQFADGTLSAKAPAEWSTQKDWDLCFRRTSVVSNGGFNGPGSVEVADLDTSRSFDEAQPRTPETELKRFESVSFADFSHAIFRPDNAVDSSIGQRWLSNSGPPVELTDGIWLVQGADAVSLFLLLVESAKDSRADTPGRVTLRVKPVKASDVMATPHP